MEQQKNCTGCGEIKLLTDFHRDKTAKKDGRNTRCKLCVFRYRAGAQDRIRRFAARHYRENKERLLAYSKEWRSVHREEAAVYRKKYEEEHKDERAAYNKEYWAKHRVEQATYLRGRRKAEPLVKLAELLRGRLNTALKHRSWAKKYSLTEYLGCSIPELKVYLEKQFKEGMSWSNHTLKGWHIDHIIPLGSARSAVEMYRLCHYTNLQPLWWWENLKKTDKEIE